MKYLQALSMIGMITLLLGCKTYAVQDDVPARISKPTAESRAELIGVISEALNGRVTTIADDALTNNSQLIIEPKHLTGRDFRRPEHFRLVLSGKRCVLVHQETESRFELTNTSCADE